MTRNDKILHDLTEHLQSKVLNNVSDYMDTCRRAGLSHPHAASELMVFFTHLAAGYAVFQFQIDEAEFIEVMRIQFKRAQRTSK